MELEQVIPRWFGDVCFVAAPGPSLTEQVAAKLTRGRVIVVNNAYERVPSADILYAVDNAWWVEHKGVLDFAGERWSTHSPEHNDKSKLDPAYTRDMFLVRGRIERYFSTDPTVIHYGRNSGFQAVNLALLLGAARVVLVGFDMRRVEGVGHFFGEHPPHLKQPTDLAFEQYAWQFRQAAKSMRNQKQYAGRVVNATPGSALKCFPFVDLDEEISKV